MTKLKLTVGPRDSTSGTGPTLSFRGQNSMADPNNCGPVGSSQNTEYEGPEFGIYATCCLIGICRASYGPIQHFGWSMPAKADPDRSKSPCRTVTRSENIPVPKQTLCKPKVARVSNLRQDVTVSSELRIRDADLSNHSTLISPDSGPVRPNRTKT